MSPETAMLETWENGGSVLAGRNAMLVPNCPKNDSWRDTVSSQKNESNQRLDSRTVRLRARLRTVARWRISSANFDIVWLEFRVRQQLQNGRGAHAGTRGYLGTNNGDLVVADLAHIGRTGFDWSRVCVRSPYRHDLRRVVRGHCRCCDLCDRIARIHRLRIDRRASSSKEKIRRFSIGTYGLTKAESITRSKRDSEAP